MSSDPEPLLQEKKGMSDSSGEMLSQELIAEFTAEIMDLTDAAEPDFLEMEKSRGNVSPELINRAFRAIHSIKGSAGFAGFFALRELSHALENVLARLREGEMILDADKTDAMLAAMDKIRVMADDIHASNEVPYNDELNRLNSVMNVKKTESDEAGPQVPDDAPETENCAVESDDTRLRLKSGMGSEAFLFEVAKETVKAAVSDGMYVFGLRVYACLSRDIRHETDRGEVYHFLFGTILELELVSQFFDIPKNQIVLFDRAELIAAMSESADQEDCGYEIFTDWRGTLPVEEQKDESHPVPTSLFSLPTSQSSLLTSHSSFLTSHETIRVSVELIDKLMNLVGEMVLGRNQLHRAIAKFIDENPHLNPLVQNLNVVISEVQENIMQMRMQPVGNVLNKIPRIVRDLARQLSKEADLTIEGGSVELDKSVMLSKADPWNWTNPSWRGFPIP